jgi:hypothetical protein
MAENRTRGSGHAAAPAARTPVLYASEKPMKKKKKPYAGARTLKSVAKMKKASRRAKRRHRDAKGHFISKSAASRRLTAKRSRVSLHRRATDGRGGSRRSRKRTVSTHTSREAPPMAKTKRTAKQKAAAKRNIKKAIAKNRAKGRAHTKTPRRRARSSKKSAPRKSWMKGLRAARAARRRNKKAGRKHPVRAFSYHRKPKRVRVRAHRSYEGGRRRQTAKQRRASLRNLRKARSARSPGRRRSSRRGHRHRYAMSNPLGGMELFVGGLTGLIGFAGTDFVDRILATHALTPKGAPDANGVQLYADTPPTTGSYIGLYNPTAITAPMSPLRWAVGGLFIVVPLGLAHYVKGDVGRSSLQMFGFGAGIRILGKGLLDLLAMLTRKTAIGQRVYDGEMRAMAIRSGDGSEANLPSAGLGRPAGAGCACGGSCPGCARALAAVQTGAGWPSMPREIAVPAPGVAPGPPPSPPMPSTPVTAVPDQPPQRALTGLPRPKARNPYLWGAAA